MANVVSTTDLKIWRKNRIWISWICCENNKISSPIWVLNLKGNLKHSHKQTDRQTDMQATRKQAVRQTDNRYAIL